MTTSSFLEDVARAFATLIQRGVLVVTSSIHDAGAFGNAAVVLAGGVLRIRLVRDRSQVIAEVASADRPEEWSSLQRVLRVILGSSAPAEGVVTTDEAALMVERYYDELQDACSSPKVDVMRAKLASLEHEAMKAFIERAKGRRN